MEDAAISELDIGNGNSIFGVFDGHGGTPLLPRTISIQICRTDLRDAAQRVQVVQIGKIHLSPSLNLQEDRRDNREQGGRGGAENHKKEIRCRQLQ